MSSAIKLELPYVQVHKNLVRLQDLKVISENPAVILTVLALATRYGYNIDQASEQNMALAARKIESLDPVEIYARIEEVIINAISPSHFFRFLRRMGMLEFVLPELKYCVDIRQGRTHVNDVYEHSLLTMDAVPTNKVTVRLAALLHDIGKYETRIVKNGIIAFDGHEKVSAVLAKSWLTWLKAPIPVVLSVEKLVLYHDVLNPIAPDAEIARIVGKDLVEDLVSLWVGNAIATGKPVPMMGHIAMRADALRRELYG